jgi:hypothetical protein
LALVEHAVEDAAPDELAHLLAAAHTGEFLAGLRE